MSDLNMSLFGPLNRDYCVWFYILSIFGFIAFVMFTIQALLIGISKRKGMDYYMSVFGISIIYLIAYFQNRLLYTMCIGSVK
jgi:hypothetical protein